MGKNIAPLPWVIESGNGETWIAPADHEWAVCKVFSGGNGDEGIEAHAAFIVKACNSHDELVAALKLAKQEIDYQRTHRKHERTDMERFNALAREFDAAITKSEVA